MRTEILFFAALLPAVGIGLSKASAIGDAEKPIDTPALKRGSDLRMAAEAKNVPIRFWGKIVDQNNSPLTGVTVRATVRHWQGGPGIGLNASFPEKMALSDQDGRFEINGGNGDLLTIRGLEKVGYELDKGALRSFGYNISENIQPDRANPIILRMWKAGAKQALIKGDKAFEIVPD